MIDYGNCVEVTLPVRFYDDHVERDLPGGRVLKRNKRNVTVSLNHEEYTELRSDADYYSDIVRYMGREFIGIQSSARALVKALDRQVDGEIEAWLRGVEV